MSGRYRCTARSCFYADSSRYWIQVKPFAARHAKRHLLSNLPFEMWKEVLGCARADDYVQSLRVSGEYYVLMRSSAREIPIAPDMACLGVVATRAYSSAKLWAQARSGCRLARISLENKWFKRHHHTNGVVFLLNTLGVQFQGGLHNVLFLLPKETPQVFVRDMTRRLLRWTDGEKKV